MSDLNSDPNKRSPGGQPGNLNAIKHGLYVQGNSIRNITPIERAQLFDLNTAINYLKDYINLTYENGLKVKTTVEINDTLKTLSIACMTLTRLINTHNDYSATSFPSELASKGVPSPDKVLDYYRKKVASFENALELQLGESNRE